MSKLADVGAAAVDLPRKVSLVPRYLRDKQGTPWDKAPRRRELRDPSTYLSGVKLHDRLLRDDHTMVSSRRGRALYRAAVQIEREGIAGAIVDCGVWNGGSTALLSNGAPTREVWAFDSFEGLPEAGPQDGAEAREWTGECLGAEDMLRKAIADHGSSERLHVVRGWFDATFPAHAAEVGPVAALHADGDWYDSVLLTLRTFYPQVVPGGFVLIDDYGYWPGAKTAVDEFRAEVGDATPMTAVDYSGRLWRKPA